MGLFSMRGALALAPTRFSIIPQPSSFVNRQIVQRSEGKNIPKLGKIFFVQFAQKFFSANCTKIWDKNILKIGKIFFKNN